MPVAEGPAAACPDPDGLSSFVDDTLAAQERNVVEEHLDGCEDCRALVAVLARAATAEQEHARSSERGLGHTSTHLDPAAVGTTRDSFADAFDATELAENVSGTKLDRPSRRQSVIREPPRARGTKLGRYVLGETLGAGGMGIVYLAHDPDLHRDVAIKILRPEFARAHRDAARRIVREARAMARLAHPNVVAVYDVGTVDDEVFVAMERVNGVNLTEWLHVADRSPAEILEVLTAAGRGLIAAHDAGMVHRDFKPDNVLVGTDGRVRVTDFGLALDVTNDEESGLIAGTPAYMAPEQHEGGNVDARSDQFGFAVSLYEALYKARPFAGTNRVMMGEAVVAGRIEPPPTRSNVPASLRAILLRALSVKPGDRFPTMGDLLKALGRDRSRRPRQLALAAFVALVSVGVAFAADAIVRDRSHAVTRTSFDATRGQLDKLVRSRTATFTAQSEALYLLPPVQAIMATRDLADFGLGGEDEDRENRKSARDALFSQTATRMGDGEVFAIGDRKARLLFTSAASGKAIDDATARAWDATDISNVPVIAEAYDARAEVYLGVLRGDDPAVVKSSLLDGARPGLFVVFARTKRPDDRPVALFVQLVEASRVLKDISTGSDTLLSVATLQGETQGNVPAGVVAGASAAGISEISIDGHEWLVERTPLRANDDTPAVAHLVLARPFDTGLAGLFPHARLTLALLAFGCTGLAIAGLLLARRRDLARPRSA